jgi:hypothetical protein
VNERLARPPIGLGDLVRAVAALGLDEQEASRAAAMLGLRAAAPGEAPAPARPAEPPVPSKKPRSLPASPQPVIESPKPLSPERATELALEPATAAPAPLPAFLVNAAPLGDAELAETDDLPPLAPLFEPAWQRSLIGALLATEAPDGSIDIDRLVDLAARRRAMARLPRRARWTLRRGAHVLVDEGEDMMPFWGDLSQIRTAILRLAGGSPTSVFSFQESPFAAAQESPIAAAAEDGEERPYSLPERLTPILAITDLGARDPARAAEWLRFAAMARRAGCPFVALSPYPAARFPRLVRRSIAIVAWDRRTRVGAARRTVRAAGRAAR